ncbi:MAG: NAD(P)H-hydrate dehydratase [Brevinematia bacterium]
MKILSADDSKSIDLRIQNEYGIDEIVLMENAGNDVYLFIKEKSKNEIYNSRFLVFCGVGNNGGDGFVVARKLLSDTDEVYVFVIGDEKKFTSPAKKNFDILTKLTDKILFLNPYLEDVRKLYSLLKEFFHGKTVIVDAVIGTGLKSRPNPNLSNVIDTINLLKEDGAIVFSVDVPSGFVCSFDRKSVLESKPVVKADYTITFFSVKAGMFLPEMKENLGNLVVSTLGFSRNFLDSLVSHNTYYLSDSTLIDIPKRSHESNKLSNGRVIFIGGSDNYFGALMMCVRSASKTGVGYIIAFTLEKFNSALKSFVPDVVSVPVPSRDRGYFSLEDASFILDSRFIKKDDVVVIGNGLGLNDETKRFFKELVKNLKDNILVIDADGINILSEDVDFMNSLENKDKIILTPHIGEFSRLIKENVDTIRDNPFSIGKRFVESFGLNLVLKDNVSYVFFCDGEIWISDLNTPVLARAGSGDILAGLIGGNISFTKSIKKGVLIGVEMLGLLSKKYNTNDFYPSPIDMLDFC